MTPRVRTAILAAGAIGGCGGVYAGYRLLYAGERDELAARVSTLNGEIKALDESLAEQTAVRTRLRAIGATMLGTKADVVDQRFRDLLWKVAQDCGLSEAVVNCGEPRSEMSPLISERTAPAAIKKALRAAPDFLIVRGRLDGVGDLEQALRAVAALQGQPWVHRVEGFVIEPEGKNRERVRITIDVASIFAPDLARADAAPAIAPSAPEAAAQVRRIAGVNVFRAPIPPTPPVIAAAAPPQPAAPIIDPISPYADWRLTAIVRGRGGVQAWLVNSRSQERVSLPVGSRVLEAVFVDAAGERAVFEIGGKRLGFTINQTLATGEIVQ